MFCVAATCAVVETRRLSNIDTPRPIDASAPFFHQKNRPVVHPHPPSPLADVPLNATAAPTRPPSARSRCALLATYHLPPMYTHSHTHTHTHPHAVADRCWRPAHLAARRHAATPPARTPLSSRHRTRCRQPGASAARSSRRSRRPHHPVAPRGGDGGDARDWRPRASRCCHHAVTPRPPRRGVDTRHRDRRTLRPWRPRAAARARPPRARGRARSSSALRRNLGRTVV